MKKFNGEHQCYNCNTKFNWEATVRDRYKSEMVAFMMNGEQAKVSFKAKNQVQVDVSCKGCGEKNIFDHNI